MSKTKKRNGFKTEDKISLGSFKTTCRRADRRKNRINVRDFEMEIDKD